PKATLEQAICPYKGLEYFDCNDHDPQFFFGRASLTNQLLDNVRTSNFLALVGASGSGKSSVLRAGLLHQLKVGRRIAGSDQWQILIMRPDATPMKNLTEVFVDPNLAQLDRAADLGKAEGLLKEGGAGLGRLVQASSAPRVVLVIDQFEEAFTRCDDLEQRQHFFDCVLGALQQEPDKFCVILAMRADFVGKCLEQEYSGLARMMEQQLVSVLPMTKDELTDAICKPAEHVGATVEPLLVQTILKEIQGAPGRLPLLQYALTQVWHEASGGELTLAGYQRLGGIDGTLQSRATTLYEAFTEEEQATCRHIFLALTQLGEGTEDTRRRVAKQDLVTAIHPQARIDAVLNKLTAPDNRLLVTSEMTTKGSTHDRMAIVDVAHEALIRHWPLLRQWIETNRDRLRQQRRIETAAVEWREQGRTPGYLLQGLPLIEAKQFQKQQAQTFPLSQSAHHFIQKSIRRRRINRLKTASWLIILALLIGGVVEYRLREEGIKADYERLNGSGSEEGQAAENLIKGCYAKDRLPRYFAERWFGNCRSLYRAPLAEAYLRSANLNSTDLRFANLRSANLRFANLRHANLNYANLYSANLSYANLSKADLHSADLSYADLSYADLSNVNFRYANLIDADLHFANLHSADLSNVNFRDADLSYADLRDADLSNADLHSANLSNTNLRDADLSNANLRFANLSNANLSNTDLSNAILLATDFRDNQKLTPEQFTAENPPLICNIALPQYILDAGINPDRDCDHMVQVVSDRYNLPLKNVQQYVERARQKTWDEPTDTPTE
ncbi:MAG TPA: pentapeptide repeat-containing protein, partial [Candidatus Obscuribacterales bacterium]